MSTEKLYKLQYQFISVDLNRFSGICAFLAAGSVCELTERVVKRQLENGFAIVRPPGHHAESHCAMGFCLLNNIALAAQLARKKYGLKRIVILDWDIHHGNGTQRMFYKSRNIMYISIHRFCNGDFFPNQKDADSHFIGEGKGLGYNINIPWSSYGYRDKEYLYAFQKLIIPILKEYNPELILISSGFDSADGDPLGQCQVTPEGYFNMIQLLKQIQPKIVLALEGGYNLKSIAKSAVACIQSLLHTNSTNNNEHSRKRRKIVSISDIQYDCIYTIDKSISYLKKYWKCLSS